jgi:hypothetical protein
MYKWIDPNLSCAIGLLIFWWFFSKFEKLELDNGTNVIKPNKTFLWAGIVTLLIYLASFVTILITAIDQWPAILMMSPFPIFSVFPILYAANWRMEFFEDGFIYQNLFRVRRFCYYSDVDYVEKNDTMIIYKKGGDEEICQISDYQNNTILVLTKIHQRPENPKDGGDK